MGEDCVLLENKLRSKFTLESEINIELIKLTTFYASQLFDPKIGIGLRPTYLAKCANSKRNLNERCAMFEKN